MSIDQTLISSLAQAIGMGLGVAIILWLFRRFSFTRRVWLSVLGVTLSLGLRLVLLAAGVLPDDISIKTATAIAIMLVANASLQLLNAILWGYLIVKLRHVVVPRLLVDLFNVVVLLAVALVILDRVFAVDLTALLVTSTVASAVVGLSLQDTLGNVIAGVALQMDRPFSVGDWVNIVGQDGEVMQTNWRTITLRSIDNHRFVIPNANVARHDIINYSQPTVLQRLHVNVGLSYTYPPGEVKRVMLQAVMQADGVCTQPPPDVLTSDYGDSAIIYDVRYWIKDYAKHPEIRDAVLTRIWYAIRREGMSVPFPIRDVNLRMVPEDQELQLRARMQQDVAVHLRSLTLFAPLHDEQIDELARQARVARYTQGEVLVRQGDEGDSLFMIKSGRVRVDVRREDGSVMTVAHRGEDEFFGEMSLLTGERRSASVIAETETEVVIVDKSVMANVLATDMATLEALSKAVEQRLREAAAKVAAVTESRPGKQAAQETNLLSRIQGFLGLK